MVRAAPILVGCLFAGKSFAYSEAKVDLFVFSSQTDAFAAARELPALEKLVSQPLTIVASSQCSNLKTGLFLIVAKTTQNNLSAAQIESFKTAVKGSYPRACVPTKESTFSLGISAIDVSFSSVKQTPINWTSTDATAKRLSGMTAKQIAVLQPRYVQNDNDPREGLIESVVVIGLRKALIENCPSAQFDQAGELVVLACATQQIAGQAVFEARVYSLPDSKLLLTTQRCSKPVIVNDGARLKCQIQKASSSGVVLVSEQTVPISGR